MKLQIAATVKQATVKQRQAASVVIASIWSVCRRQDYPSALVVPKGATAGLVERCADDDGKNPSVTEAVSYFPA